VAGDPAAFLTTIAGTAAGFVAIVGGLLVARFVTLDSEQLGAQRLLDNGVERLATARRRVEDLELQLQQADVREAIDADVIDQIIEDLSHDRTELDVEALRRVGRAPARLSSEVLRPHLVEVQVEARRAMEVLGAQYRQVIEYDDWESFRQDNNMPESSWEDVWEAVFDKLQEGHLEEQRERRRREHPLRIDFPSMVMPPIVRPAALVALDAQRQDQLLADLDHARRTVEDLAADVERLTEARDAIVRPRGLMRGLLIVAYMAAASVVWPIGLLSTSPTVLADRERWALFGAFCLGLFMLLVYLAGWSWRLSRGSASRAENAAVDE